MYFLLTVLIPIVGALVHIFVDKKPNRRTAPRVVELWLIWILAGTGAAGLVGAFGHVGPNSTEIAEDIGYRQSFFQWEVGWGDFALSIVLIMCIWKRGSFMTAAVIVLVVQYGGDAIGHIMQWVEHDNTEPGNVWAIPTDIIFPLAAAILLYYYRRYQKAGLIGPQVPATAAAA
jgi:hypothetical protein